MPYHTKCAIIINMYTTITNYNIYQDQYKFSIIIINILRDDINVPISYPYKARIPIKHGLYLYSWILLYSSQHTL